MTSYVALLRAVNVGGTGRLSMADLKACCVDAGFDRVQTYIASGNVVFVAPATEVAVKARLEQRLSAFAGKPVDVFVRTADEMRSVCAANPFGDRPANRVMVIFLAEAPTDALSSAAGLTDEVLRTGKRELYVFYPNGAGRSKLRLPKAKNGTARNMNTVAKLASLAADR